MIRLSLCTQYWKNGGMLAEQYRIWAGYPEALKAQIEILVVDDGSPERAVDVPRPEGLPSLRIYTFQAAPSDAPPWRQDAARNRGAHEAVGDWLFLTDIDHVLPAASLEKLLALVDGPDLVFDRLHRLDAPSLTPKVNDRGELHPHPNTYFMRKSRYWQIGGYDEEYCGIYGTDGYYRRQLLETVSTVPLPDVAVIRYPREVIPDASTQGGKAVRDACRNNPLVQKRMAEKRASKEPVKVLIVPCQQQYPEAA